MKRIIFAVILFPLFVGAQTSWNTEQNSSLMTESDDAEVSRGARCGSHSDFKCDQLRVFDTCDRDNSHGIYGHCRDIGQRDGEVICSCR
jgi:hypothetical protein